MVKKRLTGYSRFFFYRELGVSLEDIKDIVTATVFDSRKALCEHYEKLTSKRKQLDLLIANVEKTIELTEGRITMTDHEKFIGFKQKIIDDNERNYGEEIRKKYGADTVEKSNQKVLNMTQKQYEEVTKLANDVKEKLAAAFTVGDPAGELAQKAADLHRRWLCYFWDSYTKEGSRRSCADVCG